MTCQLCPSKPHRCIRRYPLACLGQWVEITPSFIDHDLDAARPCGRSTPGRASKGAGPRSGGPAGCLPRCNAMVEDRSGVATCRASVLRRPSSVAVPYRWYQGSRSDIRQHPARSSVQFVQSPEILPNRHRRLDPPPGQPVVVQRSRSLRLRQCQTLVCSSRRAELMEHQTFD
jgi:hypothetical protein